MLGAYTPSDRACPALTGRSKRSMWHCTHPPPALSLFRAWFVHCGALMLNALVTFFPYTHDSIKAKLLKF